MWEPTRKYTYGPGSTKLALEHTPIGGTARTLFYGFNPRGDVETLTDAAGAAAATYRYTAYGSPDPVGTTGLDQATGDPARDADLRLDRPAGLLRPPILDSGT